MNIRKLKPKRDIVIAQRIIPTQTESGIHLVNTELPDAYNRTTRKSLFATVISTGPKVNNVKPNDEIIICEFNQLDIGRNFNDQNIIAIREKDILGIRE